ncbi:MFS transporter [Oenococcus sp. UCMA 17063]|nr:MFS transporter [Oenococcus sp. UCMA 17063]
MDEKKSTVSLALRKTPFKRLTASILIGEFGLYLVLLTPVQLLITLKLTEIAPKSISTDFGIISGIGALFAMAGGPIGGILSDRTKLKFGRRRTWIAIGIIVGSISVFTIGLTSSVLLMGILWCLAQLFFNFSIAAFSALLPEQVDEGKRGSISGFMGLLIPFGPVIGMGVVSLMGAATLWIKFLVISLIGIITMFISIILLIDDNIIPSKRKQVIIKKGMQISKIYPSPRKYPIYTWGLLTKFFQSLCTAAIVYNSVMLVERFHYSSEQTATKTTLLSVTMMLFMAISAIGGGIISDKIRKQKPFVIASAIICGVALGIIAFAPTFTFVLLGMACIGFGSGMYSAVDQALMSRILPVKEDYAKDLGVVNAFGSSTQSIVPLIAPSLISLGSWPMLYGVLSIAGAISAACVVPIPELSSKAPPSNQSKIELTS